MRAADIGAGTCYFTIPIVTAIGASGNVLAIDLQPVWLLGYHAFDCSSAVILL
jgi:precorrin-6B methylase 2